jgi:protein phosphatase
LHTRYGSRTDQGRVRTSNEDCYAASAKTNLFLIADGMGGHAAGEIASQIAATTVDELVRAYASLAPEETLRRAAEEANARVYNTQRNRPDLAGMGSTLTALYLRNSHYYIAHVGDSRAYLLRDGVLNQLTRDHSLVWQLFENGVLTKEELPKHPHKNLITRSVGPHPNVEIDLEKGEARQGDVYLLCSDGLTDVVSDANIRALLSDERKTPQEIGDELVASANLNGGPDNVTVIVVRLQPGDPTEEDTGRRRLR